MQFVCPPSKGGCGKPVTYINEDKPKNREVYICGNKDCKMAFWYRKLGERKFGRD